MQYKKLPWNKSVKKKKRIYCKTFHGIKKFLEVKCFFDDPVDYLELSMFINASVL